MCLYIMFEIAEALFLFQTRLNTELQLKKINIGSNKMTHLRLEINLQRLLIKTESLSRDDSTSSNWRLEKYVMALNDMLSELQKRAEKPDPETLNGYSRRIEFLKKLVESQKIDNPVERVVALQMMSQGVSSLDGISREIQQKTASKCNLDIRNELFGTDKDELRLRKEEKSTGEDLDTLIKYHQTAQENIVKDMLLLTRDLKEQTKLANTIIKKDIETLHKSSSLADQNLSRLKIESTKLEEYNQRAWSYGAVYKSNNEKKVTADVVISKIITEEMKQKYCLNESNIYEIFIRLLRELEACLFHGKRESGRV